ncbi:MAG: hypothetical protein ACMUIU_02020 [bacterium]
MCTFYSSCVQILRNEIRHLDLPRSFVIFDEDNQLRFMKRYL